MQQFDEIQSVQIESLTHRLELANSRILELEAAERRLSSEVEEIGDKFKRAVDRAITHSQFDSIFPSHNINVFINTTNVVQRRDIWIRFLIDLNIINTKLSSIFPHNGSVDPMLILMRGSGGFGDMIYMSAIMKSFYDKFPGSRFVVLHEHPAAHVVFQSNPYVVDTISLNGERHVRFLNGAASIDVFDLIVDVRYVVTYAAPPLSRMDVDFLREAHTRSASWQKYVRREWPYLNNLLASEARRKRMGKLDLAGYTASLEINKHSFGDIFPSTGLPDELTSKLNCRAYITVHTGSDPNMAGAGGLQTKNLSPQQWKVIVSLCETNGFLTVQLGDPCEHLIDGVGVDLRGVTTFEESALILKYARVHIDTEGGLVHLAQSVGTISVVAFGPTPSTFFGYHGNINIDPSNCGDCWWTVPTWSVACPLDLPGPACMASHDPEFIASSALEVAQRTKKLELLRTESVAGSSIDIIKNILDTFFIEKQEYKSAIISPEIAIHRNLASICAHRLSSTHYIPAQFWVDIGWTDIGLARPYTKFHIPSASDSFDWVVLDIEKAERSEIMGLFMEAVRMVKVAGIVTILWPSCVSDSLSLDELEGMIETSPDQRLLKSIVRMDTSEGLVGTSSSFRIITKLLEPKKNVAGKNNFGQIRLVASRLFGMK